MTNTEVGHSNDARTINIVVAALGGEGGGVFTNWLIDVAEANNWLSQTTSLAGVAQRTGATIYYIELFPRSRVHEDKQPVMSLFPAQGDIDIAISSEIAEAGRMLQRGFVTPDRTTLISSTHRVYGITEKSDLGDGTINPIEVQQIAEKYAKSFIRYDMLALAERHHSVISSALLGAVAGSGALPFPKHGFEQVIRNTGKAVENNLAVFEASYQEAAAKVKESCRANVEYFTPHTATSDVLDKNPAFSLPEGTTDTGRMILQRLRSDFPNSVHEVAYHGLLKTLEYQDYAYSNQYLDELARFTPLDKGENDHELLQVIARYLALWMCFEDIPRVAQLKTRASRTDDIAQEVQATPEQVFHVTEFFKPRVEEMCAMLPAKLGSMLSNSKFCYSFLNLFSGGKQLRTNTLTTYFALRLLAFLRRFRLSSLGYKHEHTMIKTWLDAIESLAIKDQKAAIELAKCGRLVKGYGRTRERTTAQLMDISNLTNTHRASAEDIAELRSAALAADDNKAFQSKIASLA